MAIKQQLIALCLVFFAVVFVHALPEAAPEAEAEAEADADADAWYGYYGGHGGYGRGYGHRFGYGGYRPYGYGYHHHPYRRPYFYKPRPVAEVTHAPIVKTYGYRSFPEVQPAPVAPAPAPEPAYVRHPDPEPAYVHHPAPEPAYVRHAEPIVVPEPEPVVAPEPEPEVRSNPLPLHPVFHADKAAYAPFMPVPAVPESHFSAPSFMVAPSLPPAPAGPISRASQIVPLFDNDVAPVPEDILKIAPEPAPVPPVVDVYENDIDVIESADPVGEAPAAPVPAFEAPIPDQGVVASQYHAQDEFGNVVYGYSNPNSAKSEQRDAYGNVMGYYSYVDDTGYPKHVAYIADDFGFRITDANNFPVAA